MNKQEFFNAIAEKSGGSKKDAENFYNAFVEVVGETIKKDKIQLVGFGSFELKSKPAREARNPATGATIKVPASKNPVWKAGKQFKDKFN